MKRKFEQIYRSRFRNGCHPGATDLRMFVCEWLYNRRSELASAQVGANAYGYTYDSIGNRLTATDGNETRSYTANALNQYTSIASATRIGDRCQTPVANSRRRRDGRVLVERVGSVSQHRRIFRRGQAVADRVVSVAVATIAKPGRAVAPRPPRSARGADPTSKTRGCAFASLTETSTHSTV